MAQSIWTTPGVMAPRDMGTGARPDWNPWMGGAQVDPTVAAAYNPTVNPLAQASLSGRLGDLAGMGGPPGTMMPNDYGGNPWQLSGIPTAWMGSPAGVSNVTAPTGTWGSPEMWESPNFRPGTPGTGQFIPTGGTSAAPGQAANYPGSPHPWQPGFGQFPQGQTWRSSGLGNVIGGTVAPLQTAMMRNRYASMLPMEF